MTEEVVDQVAKEYLKRLKTTVEFEDKTNVIPFYDLDDNELGYYYQFENGEESFFMLLSSNTDYSPLFSAGSGEPDIKIIDDDGKYYYAGNVTLYKAESDTNVVDRINDALNKSSLMQKSVSKSNQLDKRELRIKKNSKSIDKWELFISDSKTTSRKDTSAVSTAAVKEDYIKGVEIMNQWGSGVDYPASSCGPTTLATIAEYWRSEESKSKIRGLDYYSEADMINHMWDTHGGTVLGMTTGKLRDAIKIHTNEHGGKYSVKTNSFNNFTTYKSEIRADRPLAIKFDDWFVFDDSWGDEYVYDYHWTTGVGYIEGDGDEIMYIHDSVGGVAYIDYVTHEDIVTMVSIDINYSTFAP